MLHAFSAFFSRHFDIWLFQLETVGLRALLGTTIHLTFGAKQSWLIDNRKLIYFIKQLICFENTLDQMVESSWCARSQFHCSDIWKQNSVNKNAGWNILRPEFITKWISNLVIVRYYYSFEIQAHNNRSHQQLYSFVPQKIVQIIQLTTFRRFVSPLYYMLYSSECLRNETAAHRNRNNILANHFSIDNRLINTSIDASLAWMPYKW